MLGRNVAIMDPYWLKYILIVTTNITWKFKKNYFNKKTTVLDLFKYNKSKLNLKTLQLTFKLSQVMRNSSLKRYKH